VALHHWSEAAPEYGEVPFQQSCDLPDHGQPRTGYTAKMPSVSTKGNIAETLDRGILV
jgi:hypothetical protein